jgi:hypothetical protein
MKLLLISIFMFNSTALLAIESALKIEDVKAVISKLEDIENTNSSDYTQDRCAGQEVITKPLNCDSKEGRLIHCELKDETTNYCFNGLEIMNDSTAGSANKGLMQIICPPSEPTEILPPFYIGFGSCIEGQSITELDFNCECRETNGVFGFFCRRTEGQN